MRFLVLISALALHIVCGEYHSSSASVGVNFENMQKPYLTGGAMAHSQTGERPRQRRMYVMCPPNFQRIGEECFSLPEQHSSWLEAHFFCKDKNAKLAEPDKYADRKLREFFLKYDAQTGNMDPIWIGSTYDYMNNMWQWSVSGRNLTYDAFSKKFFQRKKNMDNQCAVYDPQMRFRWTSRNCVDKNRFICQHIMTKVSENNRQKVYDRWNATYPHQLANEVLLEVIDRKGKGRYNRRVIPAGSNDIMVAPTKPRNRKNNRRRPRPTSASLPQQNDVNYEPQQPSTHPNDIQQHYNPTKQPTDVATANHNNDNEIRVPQHVVTPVSENVERRQNKRRRTMFDRKLQRQREKELRRLQRKKERQEKMRHEKQERLKNQRLKNEPKRRPTKEEKLMKRAEKQKEWDALHEQQKKQQEIDNLRNQQNAAEKRNLEDQEEERRRQAYLKTLKEKEEQERAKKMEILNEERERQQEEERKQHEERKAHEERMRKEYQERLKQAEDERARQLAEEQERKRLQDEDMRHKLEEEEKQRQHELKKQLDEEEERARLKRLEEERIEEEKELARLREEQRKRAEIQRKREEDIARIEEEKRRIEAEEAHIKQELEEAERQGKLQQEYEKRRAEEEVRAKQEEIKRAEESEERERLAKLEQAKLIVESQKDTNQAHVINTVKQRLQSLSPELRLEFMRQRKERKRQKMLKEQQKQKQKEQQP